MCPVVLTVFGWVLVQLQGGGIAAAMELAREEGQKALDCLACLPEGEHKRSLAGMVGYVLERIN